ncbi:MAG TPA: YdbL family protein [Caulobacteraceae bacterium]|nr:YdbL family protein [Caulobacteraceae bacterium]
MIFTRKSRALGLAALVAVALSGVAPAYADVVQSKAVVEAAKAQGGAGEQADGYLGIVAGGDAALRAAVAEINAGRAEAYRETAAKTGVTPEAAAEATARQLIARVPPGQYYKPLGGAWTRK